jgi:RNA polymerase sigma-70 factor, ECF subfamily
MMGAKASDTRRLWLVTGGSRVPEDVSDEELVAALQRGDRRLGDKLYERLVNTVDATLCRTLGGRDPQHDDLAQIAFEQIVTTLANHRYAKACSLKSWAGAITANIALNAIRSRRSEHKVFDKGSDALVAGEASADRRDTELALQARHEFERVRKHLARMNPERAEALVLHDMLGHEVSEMAVLLGISVPAAQSRLVRGRKELRERLLADGSAEGGEAS